MTSEGSERYIHDILRYLDDGNRFGYAQFLNNIDQLEYKVSDLIQSVILIDTRTNYFNATRLADSLSVNGHTLTTLMSSKTFLATIDELEKKLNHYSSNPNKSSL